VVVPNSKIRIFRDHSWMKSLVESAIFFIRR
jgi:hypothetical protein